MVNVTSVEGKVAAPLAGGYCGTKHALEALSESLAFEVGHFGVRVVIVEPGYIAPGMRNAVRHHEDGTVYEELRRQWSGADETLVGPGRPARPRAGGRGHRRRHRRPRHPAAGPGGRRRRDGPGHPPAARATPTSPRPCETSSASTGSDQSLYSGSRWVTGSSPLSWRSVFFSFMSWMKMSCSGLRPGTGPGGSSSRSSATPGRRRGRPAWPGRGTAPGRAPAGRRGSSPGRGSRP